MQGQRLATVTEALPTQWLTRVEKHGHGLKDVTAIDRHEQAIEMLLMGMRVREGLFLPSLYERTGYDIEMSVIDEMTEAGLLMQRDMGDNAATLRATERGVLLLNRLTEGLAAGLVDLRGD
jgi:oxygen-independent coproporphyrinogen-3 oxidase